VWLATGDIPIFISFLMVVPLIWANVHTGIAGTDTQLLEMAKVYRFSPARKIGYLYVPSVMPYFTAACSTGLGFAWKSGIAAEVIALPALAIGKQIYNAKIYLETVDLFAWTIAVILLSVLLERTALWGLGKLERTIVKGR
jgi:NitT/TauT family transport system permease protein